jgi:2-oxoisovalerate ferredoxin oxidoreductase delta subunit
MSRKARKALKVTEKKQFEDPHMSKNDKEPYPVINTLECKACGRCLLACPKGVLFMSENLNVRGYNYIEYKGEGCSGCLSCYYTCPEPLAIEIHIPLKDEEEK